MTAVGGSWWSLEHDYEVECLWWTDAIMCLHNIMQHSVSEVTTLWLYTNTFIIIIIIILKPTSTKPQAGKLG